MPRPHVEWRGRRQEGRGGGACCPTVIHVKSREGAPPSLFLFSWCSPTDGSADTPRVLRMCVCGQVVNGRSSIGCSTTQWQHGRRGRREAVRPLRGRLDSRVASDRPVASPSATRTAPALVNAPADLVCTCVCIRNDRCGLQYTKTLQQAQQRKGRTGGTLGAVPLLSLLNRPEDRKRRMNLSSPMLWQTKAKNFVSSSLCSSIPHANRSNSSSSSP